MIHLDRSPVAALEFMSDVAQVTQGLEMPSELFLPPRLRGHRATKIPYEVLPADDPTLSVHPDLPQWGGMTSDDFDRSVFFVTDNVSEEARPHIAALNALLTAGENPRIIRTMLEKAFAESPELAADIAGNLMVGFRYFEQYYSSLTPEQQEEFRQVSGFDHIGHRASARSVAGEVLFTNEMWSGLVNRVLNSGVLKSEVLGAEIPYSRTTVDTTRSISNPLAIPGLEITGISLAKEPDNPRKPHVCVMCKGHIAPKSLRPTLKVVDLGDGYDHHHVHASCIR